MSTPAKPIPATSGADHHSYPQGFRPRARVLIYQGTTNIGDAIQTVAMARLLGGPCAGVYRDSPMPDLFCEAPFVVNGWLGRGSPVSGANCIFAGVHLGHREPDYIRWMRQSRSIIGARDNYTRGLLASNGVPSETIACATLTFPRYRGPRRGRYSIDVAPVPGTESGTSLIPDLPWASQWDLALHRLDQLRKAEVVYSRRLHVILPCLAFGTPVVFPCGEFRDLFDKSRLELLHEIGFVYDEPVEMDVTPIAERFLKFLGNALNAPVTPVDEPPMPIPIIPPDTKESANVEAAAAAGTEDCVKPVWNIPFTQHGRSSPSITALVVSRNGSSRLAACLESIRRADFAQDIVVCIDDRTTDNSVALARSFTPHVHLVRGGYFEALLPRAIPFCQGDFVLRLDDDEQLGGNWNKESFDLLVRFNDITHFWTPRRWIVPPGDQFLACDPWFPDLQMRLFDRRLVSASPRLHDHLAIKGRSLVLCDRWIEHFNLVFNSRAEREEKCRFYVEVRPDHDLSAFYLYEDQNVTVMPMSLSALAALDSVPGRPDLPRALPYYTPGTELDFRTDGNAAAYLLDGWGNPEVWGTWIVGEEARLCLPLKQSLGCEATVKMAVTPFVHPNRPVSRALVLYAGDVVAEWSFDTSAVHEEQLALPASTVSNDRSPALTFRILDPVSPAALGLSADSRRLGLGLVSLRMVPGQE
ncbi:MAG: glycosyltransferase [Acidobacteria bacterium]|nr:glycosyltransferase [Acidobacteriota bacterium]